MRYPVASQAVSPLGEGRGSGGREHGVAQERRAGLVVEGRRSNGDVVRFDHRTGTLGVYRGDVIIAWFRPDEGDELFVREVAK